MTQGSNFVVIPITYDSIISHPMTYGKVHKSPGWLRSPSYVIHTTYGINPKPSTIRMRYHFELSHPGDLLKISSCHPPDLVWHRMSSAWDIIPQPRSVNFLCGYLNSFIVIVKSCHICIHFVWWLTLTSPSIWYCIPYNVWSEHVNFIICIS